MYLHVDCYFLLIAGLSCRGPCNRFIPDFSSYVADGIFSCFLETWWIRFRIYLSFAVSLCRSSLNHFTLFLCYVAIHSFLIKRDTNVLKYVNYLYYIYFLCSNNYIHLKAIHVEKPT